MSISDSGLTGGGLVQWYGMTHPELMKYGDHYPQEGISIFFRLVAQKTRLLKRTSVRSSLPRTSHRCHFWIQSFLFGDIIPQNLFRINVTFHHHVMPSMYARRHDLHTHIIDAILTKMSLKTEKPQIWQNNLKEMMNLDKKKNHKKDLSLQFLHLAEPLHMQHLNTMIQKSSTRRQPMQIWRMCRGEGLKAILSPDQVDLVRDILRKQYSVICHTHRWYSSFGTGSMVAMNMGMFRMFLGKIKIMHDRDTRDSVNHANVLQRRMAENKEMLTVEGEIKENESLLTENDVVMIFKKAETSVWARKAGDMKNSVKRLIDLNLLKLWFVSL